MATFSVSNTFVANTKAKAADVNTNFTDVLNILAAHHHDPNIYTGAKPITNSGIADNAQIRDTQLKNPITLSGLISAAALQVVTVPKGGTGLLHITAGDLIYASSDNVFSTLPKGSDGQFLTLAGGLPSWVGVTPAYTATSFTAGEALTAGQPLALGLYQSDGGVLLDSKSVATNNRPTFTTSVNIGYSVTNNANRLLIFVFASSNEGNVSVSWNGTGMTSGFSALTNNGFLNVYYLVAPSTGSANFTVSGLASSGGSLYFQYGIYSYYNCAQSAPAFATNTATSTSSASVNNTPSQLGSLILVAADSSNTSGTLSSTTDPNNSAYILGSGGNYPAIYCGDTGRLASTSAHTSTVTGAGTPSWNIASVCISPYTAATYAAFKASSATATPNKYDSFFGFALASVSSGQSVTVATSGVVPGLSGLTTGSKYYLNDTAGTIGTSAGTNSRKVGIALSSTTLLITNVW